MEELRAIETVELYPRLGLSPSSCNICPTEEISTFRLNLCLPRVIPSSCSARNKNFKASYTVNADFSERFVEVKDYIIYLASALLLLAMVLS